MERPFGLTLLAWIVLLGSAFFNIVCLYVVFAASTINVEAVPGFMSPETARRSLSNAAVIFFFVGLFFALSFWASIALLRLQSWGREVLVVQAVLLSGWILLRSATTSLNGSQLFFVLMCVYIVIQLNQGDVRAALAENEKHFEGAEKMEESGNVVGEYDESKAEYVPPKFVGMTPKRNSPF